MDEYLEILGYKVRDRVTGFEGVAATVGFDLYGCIQVIVTPRANDKGEKPEGHWFDYARLETIDGPRVMTPPAFALNYSKGPTEKPAR